MTPDEDEVRSLVEDAADEFLSGPTTVEVTEWDDGNYRIDAYHSIEATYPIEEELRTPGGLDGDDALPFYRERVFYSTTDRANHVLLQVVRRRTGRTGWTTVYETPVAFVGPRDHRTADAADLFVDGEPVGRLDSFPLFVENSLSPAARQAREETNHLPYGRRKLSGSARLNSIEVPVPDPDDPAAVADYVQGLRRSRELADSILSVEDRLNEVYEDAQATANEEVEPVRVTVGPDDPFGGVLVYPEEWVRDLRQELDERLPKPFSWEGSHDRR